MKQCSLGKQKEWLTPEGIADILKISSESSSPSTISPNPNQNNIIPSPISYPVSAPVSQILNYSPPLDPPPSLPFNLIITNSIERYRAESFWHKEPETLAWISHFEENGIFFDIGANIGLYSLFCAKNKQKMKIFSFEPQLGTFSHLCRNILENDFRNVVPVYAGAGHVSQSKNFQINSVNKLASGSIPGSSGGFFSGSLNLDLLPIDSDKTNDETIIFSSILFKLDDFAGIVGAPAYVKIDTDGFEGEILAGMAKLLENKNLKSILIELDKSNNEKMFNHIHFITSHGFNTNNQFNIFEPHSRTRRNKEGIMAENIIFTRP